MSNDSKDKKRSSSHERAIKGYLTVTNDKFLQQYIQRNNIGQSEAVNAAVAALREKSK